jgi:hypothetical protein
MKKIPPAPILPRGRIATWTPEKLATLSTAELKSLLENAERLQEAEVAQLCRAIIKKRPRGTSAVRPVAAVE